MGEGENGWALGLGNMREKNRQKKVCSQRKEEYSKEKEV